MNRPIEESKRFLDNYRYRGEQPLSFRGVLLTEFNNDDLIALINYLSDNYIFPGFEKKNPQ